MYLEKDPKSIRFYLQSLSTLEYFKAKKHKINFQADADELLKMKMYHCTAIVMPK